MNEVSGFMTPLIATILTVLMQGTEAVNAVSALIKLSQGMKLESGDHVAIGVALEAAHRRLAGVAVPRPGVSMSIPPVPPSPPPAPAS